MRDGASDGARYVAVPTRATKLPLPRGEGWGEGRDVMFNNHRIERSKRRRSRNGVSAEATQALSGSFANTGQRFCGARQLSRNNRSASVESGTTRAVDERFFSTATTCFVELE